MQPTFQADFDILHEDEEFLAVNKPPGLIVHPTKPHGPPTHLHGLRALLAFELATGGQISIINRLDRETSGIVLVAKSLPAARQACQAMEVRQVTKLYDAWVFGWPQWNTLTVSEPIALRRHIETSPVHLERCIHPKGEPATTHFQVLERHQHPRGPWAKIRARPITGRTHQIRVHLAFTGHPVIGDKLYARSSLYYLEFIKTGWSPRLEHALWLPRHALHCSQMELLGRKWQSPPPQDILATLQPAMPLPKTTASQP